MLTGLTIKNLALIESLEMTFTSGLNVLTGETGAGKSVLIGSVNIALGEKADASLIRDGKDSALIELVFHVDDEETAQGLREAGYPPEEDGLLVLQRKLYSGRSVCKINGETVPVRILKSAAEHLISIHGQNDQRFLRSESEQLKLIDRFAGGKVPALKADLASATQEYRRLCDEAEGCAIDEKTRLREMDLIRYELAEIEEAALSENEDVQLEERFRAMETGRKSYEALAGALSILDGENESAMDRMAKAQQRLAPLTGYEEIDAFHRRLSETENLLSDAVRDMKRFLEDTSFSEEEYRTVTERLNRINRLKEKYASVQDGVDAVLAYAEDRRQELSRLEDLASYRRALAEKTAQARTNALQLAEKLSALRAREAARFSGKLKEALGDLNFNDVRFEVRMQSDESILGANGYDRITFMISTNTGEKIRPLSEVASGGELSRIMLGIKTVMADRNDAVSMIFDEIDAGVSGQTAWKVAEKLSLLAGERQVICITHLAQIAAMYDTHFLIYKDVTGNRTYTHIKPLSDAESIGELARLVAAGEVTEGARAHASDMRKKALASKKRGGGSVS